jgi:hypothetical protein
VSIDKREEILVRLVQVISAIPGVWKVYRNRPAISAAQRPAIVVLDSDEEGTLGAFALGRPLASPGIMRMTPEVCLMAAGESDTIGASLSAMRFLVIPAILTDDFLSTLVGTIGGVQYQGCTTDLGRGRTMEGELVLNFEIHYALKLSEM